MAVSNIGSIALNIYNFISPLSSNISGQLINIVDNQRIFIEQYTGDTIGSPSITEKYQFALTQLSTANTIKLMAVQEGGVKSVSLGDLSTDNSNLMEMAKQFEEQAIFSLKSLSKSIKFFKARG